VSGPTRQYPRYAHEAAVTIRLPGIEHHGRTKNVSRGGLCAEFLDPIPLGSDVEIDLQLVFDDDQHSEPLRLPGRIVWCTEFDEAHQVGVMFKPLDADLAQYITMFLRYLDDGTKPTRSPRRQTLDKRFD
jgi:PilZ domain-containing protein